MPLSAQLTSTRARALEDLRDVDEVGALLACDEHLRHPCLAELGAVRGGDDLLRRDVGPAVEEASRQARHPRRSQGPSPRSSRRTVPAAPTGAGTRPESCRPAPRRRSRWPPPAPTAAGSEPAGSAGRGLGRRRRRCRSRRCRRPRAAARATISTDEIRQDAFMLSVLLGRDRPVAVQSAHSYARLALRTAPDRCVPRHHDSLDADDDRGRSRCRAPPAITMAAQASRSAGTMHSRR